MEKASIQGVRSQPKAVKRKEARRVRVYPLADIEATRDSKSWRSQTYPCGVLTAIGFQVEVGVGWISTP